MCGEREREREIERNQANLINQECVQEWLLFFWPSQPSVSRSTTITLLDTFLRFRTASHWPGPGVLAAQPVSGWSQRSLMVFFLRHFPNCLTDGRDRTFLGLTQCQNSHTLERHQIAVDKETFPEIVAKHWSKEECSIRAHHHLSTLHKYPFQLSQLKKTIQ